MAITAPQEAEKEEPKEEKLVEETDEITIDDSMKVDLTCCNGNCV